MFESKYETTRHPKSLAIFDVLRMNETGPLAYFIHGFAMIMQRPSTYWLLRSLGLDVIIDAALDRWVYETDLLTNPRLDT